MRQYWSEFNNFSFFSYIKKIMNLFQMNKEINDIKLEQIKHYIIIYERNERDKNWGKLNNSLFLSYDNEIINLS